MITKCVSSIYNKVSSLLDKVEWTEHSCITFAAYFQ